MQPFQGLVSHPSIELVILHVLHKHYGAIEPCLFLPITKKCIQNSFKSLDGHCVLNTSGRSGNFLNFKTFPAADTCSCVEHTRY